MEPYIVLKKWKVIQAGRLFKVLGYGMVEKTEVAVTIGVFTRKRDAIECYREAPKQPRWYC